MSKMKQLKQFEDLYNEYFVYLSLVSFGVTKDMEASKDIVQDYFVSLWNKNKDIVFSSGFKPYSYKAVKNLSLKHLEKSSNKFTTESVETLNPVNVLEEEIQEPSQKAVAVLKLLEQLPLSRKTIFTSHVINGLSYSEIAENQNISVNTVKTQMKRVYAFIREELKNANVFIVLFIVLKDNF